MLFGVCNYWVSPCLPQQETSRGGRGGGCSSCVRHVWGLACTEKVMEFAVGHGCFQQPGYPGRFPVAFISITSVTRWLQNPSFDLKERGRKNSLIHKDWYSLKGILFRIGVLNSFLFCDLPSCSITIKRCPSNSERLGRPCMVMCAGSCDVDFMEMVHWGTIPKNVCLWDIKHMPLVLKTTASPMVMQLFIF